MMIAMMKTDGNDNKRSKQVRDVFPYPVSRDASLLLKYDIVPCTVS